MELFVLAVQTDYYTYVIIIGGSPTWIYVKYIWKFNYHSKLANMLTASVGEYLSHIILFTRM